jgi:hypothetical protein
MQDFRKLATMTERELAWLGGPPTVAAPPVTTGIVDPASFETFETVANEPAATARAITNAAKLAKSGGPPLPKLSATAKAILAAGVRRRAGG